jgi:hypothetical protein
MVSHRQKFLISFVIIVHLLALGLVAVSLLPAFDSNNQITDDEQMAIKALGITTGSVTLLTAVGVVWALWSGWLFDDN